MKRIIFISIAIFFSLFANAQYADYPINRKAAGNYKHRTSYDKELFNRVEKEAFVAFQETIFIHMKYYKLI